MALGLIANNYAIRILATLKCITFGFKCNPPQALPPSKLALIIDGCTVVYLWIGEILKWLVSHTPYLIHESSKAPHITGSGVLLIVKSLECTCTYVVINHLENKH